MGRLARIFFVVLAAALVAHGQTPEPYWKTKPKVRDRIEQQRAIVVSVRDEESKDAKNPKHLFLSGAGQTRTPARWTFAEAQKFENLKKISDHFKEVKWEAARSELYLHGEAFKYHARMHVKIETQSESEPYMITFNVVRGSFSGLKGKITFEDNKRGKTLIGFQADYGYKKLPMPAFFIEFGLEFVLQRVAGALREFLEKTYGESGVIEKPSGL